MANSNKGKLEIFFEGLRSNIAKDVMIGDNPFRSFFEALGKALRFETMR